MLLHFRCILTCAVITTVLVAFSGSTSSAAGKIVNVYPVPLLSAVTKTNADKISKALADAFDRIPGYQARLIDNTPPKTTYGVYVIEGSLNAETASSQSAFPKPTGSASPETNEVVVTGSIKNIYALSAKEAKAPESTPAYVDVTSQLLPVDNSQYCLKIYVKSLLPDGKATNVQSGQLPAGTIDQIVSTLNGADLSPMLAFSSTKSFRRVILAPLLSDVITGTDALYINSRFAAKLSNAGVLAIPSDTTKTFASSPDDFFKQCLNTGADGIMAYAAINNGPRPTLFGFARNTAELGVQYYSCLGEQLWSGSGSGKKVFWQSPSQGLSFTYQLIRNLDPDKFDHFHHIGDALTLFTSVGNGSAGTGGFSIDYAGSDNDFKYVAINRAIDDVVDRFCASYLLNVASYQNYTTNVYPTGAVCNTARATTLMAPTPPPVVWSTPSPKPSATPVPMALSLWLTKLPSATVGNLFPSEPLAGETASARYEFHGLPSLGLGVWYDATHNTVAYRILTSTGDRVTVLEKDVPQPNTLPAPKKADLSEVSLNNGVRLGMSLNRTIQEYGRRSEAQTDKVGYWSLSYPSKPAPQYCASANTVVFDSVHGNVVQALETRDFHCKR